MGLGNEYIKLLNQDGEWPPKEASPLQPLVDAVSPLKKPEGVAELWNDKPMQETAVIPSNPEEQEVLIPYNMRNFKNSVEKQRYYDTLPGKYGEFVKGRENYLDAWNKDTPARVLSLKYPLEELWKGELADVPKEISEIYSEFQKLDKESKQLLTAFDQLGEDQDYTKQDEVGIKMLEVGDKMYNLEHQWQLNPANLNYAEDDKKQTWSQLITSNPNVKNPVLLFASLMDEGADTFSEEDYYMGKLSGYERFGLDTFGSRVDEFIKKGYVDPSIKERMTTTKNTNELNQAVVSPMLTDLSDVVAAKNAFILAGQDMVEEKAKELGVELSPKAKDYFTIATYNLGEGGTNRMMEIYKNKGWMDDEEFLKRRDLGLYPQAHHNIIRRLQAVDMLEKELINAPSPVQAPASEDEPPIFRGGGIIKPEISIATLWGDKPKNIFEEPKK